MAHQPFLLFIYYWLPLCCWLHFTFGYQFDAKLIWFRFALILWQIVACVFWIGWIEVNQLYRPPDTTTTTMPWYGAVTEFWSEYLFLAREHTHPQSRLSHLFRPSACPGLVSSSCLIYFVVVVSILSTRHLWLPNCLRMTAGTWKQQMNFATFQVHLLWTFL